MRLSAPKGDAVRPTADAVRESLFNLLGQNLQGKRFLDLFGGSGAVGLEAASRGASVVIVEKSPLALRCVEQNIQHCRLQEQVTAQRGDALAYLARSPQSFDVIFVDPPFDQTHYYGEVMEKVANSSVLATDGLLVLEHRSREPVAAASGFELHDQRAYGKNALSFFIRLQHT